MSMPIACSSLRTVSRANFASGTRSARRVEVHLLALDEQPALVLLLHAGEDLDQARLAGAVVAEDARDLVRVDVHAHVAERDHVAVVLRDPVGLEQVRRGGGLAHRTFCARLRTTVLRMTAAKRIT